MKKTFLLPRRCRLWGTFLFAASALWGIYILFIEESCWKIQFDLLQAVKTNTAIIGTLVGLYMMAFSKENIEDELVMSLRADAMIKALFFSSLVIVLCALFSYGVLYLQYLSVSQYTVLILYIVIFRYNMHRHLNNNEE